MMRVGRGTNCPGEGDICSEWSRKRSLQSVTPRRTPTHLEGKAEAGGKSREEMAGRKHCLAEGQHTREAQKRSREKNKVKIYKKFRLY